MNDILNYIVSKFKCEIDAMNTVNYTTGYGTKKKYFVYSWMTDDITLKNTYVRSQKLKEVLKTLDDLFTLQIYYDIVVLNIKSESDRPRCPVCGKFIKFDCLSHGYPKTCSKDCHLEIKRQAAKITKGFIRKGDTQLESTKKKISNTLKGRKMSDEWKRKHSEYMKKFHNSPDGKEFFKKVAQKVSENNIKLLKENQNSYRYNKNFKKGNYHSDIFNKNFNYDSGWELMFIKYVEDNSIKEDIKVFDRCLDTVKYVFNGTIHRYLPDFFIEFNSGIRLVIEIKPEYLITDEKVQAKIKAGKEYFSLKNIKYVTLTEKLLLTKGGREINSKFSIKDLI